MKPKTFVDEKPPKEKVSEIRSALDNQYTVINSLNDTVQSLLNKLEPILKVTGTKKVSSATGETQTFSAPLAIELNEIADNICFINRRLIDILNACEL